jgi:Trk-type K+ transport system membrane component
VILIGAVIPFLNELCLAMPIALVVAVVHKTTKVEKLMPLILQSLKLFAYILLGMAAVGFVLYWLAPVWPEQWVP